MSPCCNQSKGIITAGLVVFIFPIIFANHEYKRLCLVTCPTIITESSAVVDPYFVIFSVAAYKGRVWAASPNINGAQSATLVEVEPGTDGSCLFRKYPPSLSPLLPPRKGLPPECRFLYSVTVVKVDCFNRMWILDPGILGFDIPYCPPILVVIDINTNKVIHVFEIPVDVLNPGYHFDDMVVQVDEHDRDKVYVHLADQSGYAICTMCYQCGLAKRGKACWSCANARQFYPDHHYAVFRDNGNELVFMIGVHAITLGGRVKNSCCYKSLYFHPLSGNKEYTIDIKYLTDLNKTGTFDEAMDKVQCVGKRDSQSAGEVMTADGILFQTLVGDKKSIVCWDSKTPYRKLNLVEVLIDKYFWTLMYVTIEGDGKCCKTHNKHDNLFISSANFLDYVLHGLTFTCKKVNAIISYVPIDSLLKDGKCLPNTRKYIFDRIISDYEKLARNIS